MAFLWKFFAVGLGFAASVSSLSTRTGRHSTPTVRVKNGTYSGIHSPQYDQDFFLGIPYAQVPKRFTVAEGLDTSWHGKHKATEYPPHCIGYGGDDIGYDVSEDCLYLNVVRPAGIKDTTGLPVAVWIHGGGLVMGGSADRRYNLSFIVEHSVELGTPIIGVSLNYRLSAFGFLVGEEAQEAGATNIGFRDQRLALQWTQENIAAFGGSPEKVVIFGESSGAESVSAQVFAYNGRDDGLFRGAVGQSGFGSVLDRYTGGFNATEEPQNTYNNLVRNTSCADLVGTVESLDCLRDAPFEEINKAINVTRVGPWAPVLDNDFFVDFAANQASNGNFVQVPILIGANSDEGTAFGGSLGVSTDAEFRAAIATRLQKQNTDKTTDQLIDELSYLYPNIQSIGIPSLKTWPYIIQPGDSYAQTRGLQSRRTAALFGDIAMQYRRRRSNIAWAAHGIPSYAYRFDVTVNGLPENTGATHFQEVAFVFLNLRGDGYAVNPLGGTGKYPRKAKALAKTMSAAWINFVTGLDPNGKSGLGIEGTTKWPSYDINDGGGVGKGIVWDIDKSFVEMDDWRAEGINWLIDHALAVFGS